MMSRVHKGSGKGVRGCLGSREVAGLVLNGLKEVLQSVLIGRWWSCELHFGVWFSAAEADW